MSFMQTDFNKKLKYTEERTFLLYGMQKICKPKPINNKKQKEGN